MNVHLRSVNVVGLGSEHDPAILESELRSAGIIVPLILSLFPQARSVIDVGGTTLGRERQFEKRGLTYSRLESNIVERFDLCVSLHASREADPQQYVGFLAGLSDIIIFSAPLPEESDEEGRWPSYWASLFITHGYKVFDLIRGPLWYDQRVAWQYAQSMLVFAKGPPADLLERQQKRDSAGEAMLDVVHPQLFLKCLEASSDRTAKIAEVLREEFGRAGARVPLYKLCWWILTNQVHRRFGKHLSTTEEVRGKIKNVLRGTPRYKLLARAFSGRFFDALARDLADR